jgi:DNA-directed RNA polymerase specialized sigma24 family protein
MSAKSPDRGPAFPDTLWSKVLALQNGSASEAATALAVLCQSYWYPLYFFVRVRGYGVHDAQDLTQSFFAHLLSHDSFRTVERERGRFRTFLLTCLENFLVNEWKKRETEKRGGKVLVIPWDELDEGPLVELSPSENAAPEKLYDRTWAVAIVNRVIEAVKKEYSRAGRGKHFEMLRHFLPGAMPTMSCADAAEKLEMSRPAFDVACHRLRHRFGKVLREEVGQTVRNPADVDDELQYLLSAWSGAEESSARMTNVQS